MPYKFTADSFHLKKLCSRLSSSKVRDFRQKSAVLRFWDHLWVTLGQCTMIILGSLESS